MNKTDATTAKKVLTTDMLDTIAKETLKDYMNKIKQYGGVSSEKAMYGLIMEIIVTLETQHGAVDAKKVMKDIVDQIYAVV